MKIRKNKNYTSILLEEFTPQEATKAQAKRSEIEKSGENCVIKPSPKKWIEALKLNSRLVSDCEMGESYRILGVLFTVVKIDTTKTCCNCNAVTFEYYKQGELTQTGGCFGFYQIYRVLFENAFEAVTGTLLYF
ncbi:hypothetical protein PGA94_09590 [Pediococcus pentosaceus]|uniref:hypothetical protein n=1 Tax=Pediococcus pentosaceus TaxID=1255 RepID=UPI00232E7A72|nr:hypothetical protein [Pediococcus pentosaceus]MDB1563025.1 hypothetical protein [Pediococcus pentosaceus]